MSNLNELLNNQIQGNYNKMITQNNNLQSDLRFANTKVDLLISEVMQLRACLNEVSDTESIKNEFEDIAKIVLKGQA